MRTPTWLLAVTAALALNSLAVAAGDNPETALQTKQKLDRRITKTVRANYLLYLPKEYKARPPRGWPLILFLHGAGERGTNRDLVTIHGRPKLVKQGK